MLHQHCTADWQNQPIQHVGKNLVMILTKGLFHTERLGDLLTYLIVLHHEGSQYLPMQYRGMVTAKGTPSVMQGGLAQIYISHMSTLFSTQGDS